MIEEVGAPAVAEGRPWKNPDVLEWLNRLRHRGIM